jgi:excisionase family DNA binding protein
MDDKIDFEDYLTSNEAGQILGITNKSIQRHIKNGEIRAFKRGGRYFIHRDEITSFKPRVGGRPRKNMPSWRFAPEANKLIATSIEAGLREGITEKAFVRALEVVKRSDEYLFPGTIARYVLSEEEEPRQVEFLLIWRQSSMPAPDEIESALAALGKALASVLDWSTARARTRRVWMHTQG